VLSVNPGLSATALRLLIVRTARAFPDLTCTALTCGGGIVDAAAAVIAAAAPAAAAPEPPAPAPPPADAPAEMTMAPPAATAVEVVSSGGGGGGGGCALAHDGAPELALPLAFLWAVAMVLRRRHARAVDLAARA
jgi:hypothetical protein